MLDHILQEILNARFRDANYRVRQISENTGYLNFCSNDYLGLRSHHKIIAAAKKAADKYGIGSGSAYLLTGYTSAHQALEEELAEFLNFPRVLLFSSGYMANTGIIAALLNRKDHIFADRFIHASLLDGCLLSKAKLTRFQHINLRQLKNLLEQSTAYNKMIITEGVFGMDGTISPLQEILSIKKKFDCSLLLDDAHGIGILGNNGRGCIEFFALDPNDITILVGTLGKAFGSYGAFVACKQVICETLIQTARTYLFTTAIPPIIVEAARMSLKMIQSESWRRIKLMTLVERFQKGAEQLNIPLAHSNKIPIQLIKIGDNKLTQQISKRLLELGIIIKPILPPTVPKNTARLRITLTADHTEQQIDFLLERLSHVISKFA